MKEEEKEKEKDQRERERVTRGSTGGVAVKEEREKASSSQSEDLAAERCTVIGGPKRKEMDQLKIVRVDLK